MLSTVDDVILTEVYSAGEAPIVAADGRSLVHAVGVAVRKEPLFVETPAEMPQAILDMATRRRCGDRDGRRFHRAGGGKNQGVAQHDGAARQMHRRTAAAGEPMSRHTSWRVGGPADRLYIPGGLEDLAAFLKGLPSGEPVHFVGLGSNLLVRDGGVRGTVILLHDALTEMHFEGDMVYAEAGVTCRQARQICCAPAPAWRGVHGRHSRHGGRRAGDERRLPRRRDLGHRGPRVRP